MDLKNFFCLRSNLSNLCTFCLKARSEMDTDFRGLVWKRMGKISRNWAAHPHQEFPGVPLPLPPGSKATRTLTSWTSWKATGSLISRLIERSCLIQRIWMLCFITPTVQICLVRALKERRKATSGCYFWSPVRQSFRCLLDKFTSNVQSSRKLWQIRAGFYLSNIFYSFSLVLLVSYLSNSARDLQAFLVFSQHPKWVITPVNP